MREGAEYVTADGSPVKAKTCLHGSAGGNPLQVHVGDQWQRQHAGDR